MQYQVSEIYRAVQGEGWHAGMPCTLVRLQGCNLRCEFCDTSYAQDPKGGKKVSLNWIYGKVEVLHRKGDIILITGGEPTQQILRPLILALRHLGPVHLETNGTSETLGPTSTIADWITVSPKPPVKCTASSFHWADEIKWLIGCDEDVIALKKFLLARYRRDAAKKRVSVQPISQNPEATEIAYRACLTYGWRLSIQIHKLIGAK